MPSTKQRIKPVKGWAVINWSGSAIVNDGTGQKRIYRLKSQAIGAAFQIGYGTSVIPVLITPIPKKGKKK